jgi:hypothetical protein
MRNLAIFVAIFSILFVGLASAQVTYPLGVSNTLKSAGIDPSTLSDLESFSYGPFVVGASGEEYLPPAELARWQRDIWESGENHVLIMGGTYDKKRFSNAKMNFPLNGVLGNSRGMVGFSFALPKERMGQIRLVLMMEPVESETRMGFMYRVALPEPAKSVPAVVTTIPVEVTAINAMEARIDYLTKIVAELKTEQPAPKDIVPFDGLHLYAGVFIGGQLAPKVSDGTPDLPLVPRGFAFTLSFNGRQKLGVGVAGAYEGQGGISMFTETDLYDLYGRGATLIAGTSLSIFRKLDKTASPRSARYGQLYVGVRGLLDIIDAHPIEVVLALGTSFEVLTTKDGGVRFADWNARGVMLRVSCLAF